MSTRQIGIAFAVATLATLSAAGSATVAPGDRISGSLGDGDADSLSFYVGAASSLDVRAKLDKDLRIAFRVVGPGGSEFDVASATQKALTRKPSLRHVALTQVGTYRLVIEQSSGEGEYDLQFRLGKHSPRVIDMTAQPPGGDAAQVLASAVTFDPRETLLSGTTVQAALAEVADALDGHALVLDDLAVSLDAANGVIDAVATTVDDAATDIEELLAASDTAAAERTVLSGHIAALGARVEVLESASEGTGNTAASVLVAGGGTVVDAALETVGATQKWVIDSTQIASTSIAANQLAHGLVAIVQVTYVASSSDPAGNPGIRFLLPEKIALWADLGGTVEQLLYTGTTDVFSNITEQELGDDGAAAMGIPDALRTAPLTYTYELAHALTDEQAGNGFDLVIRVGMLATDRDDLSQISASLRIESVLILGQ